MSKQTRGPQVVVVGAANASAAEVEAAVAVARGGISVGLLPRSKTAQGNSWPTIAGRTGEGHGSQAIWVAVGEPLTALGSGPGTLSKIGLALKAGTRAIGPGTRAVRDPRGRSAAILIAKPPGLAGAFALESGPPGVHGET